MSSLTKNLSAVKNFLEWIETTQLPFNSQEHTMENGMPWTCDMWSMETLRAMILGDAYLTTPMPDYVSYRDSGFAHLMLKYGKRKIATLEKLEEIANVSNNIIIGEVGRGLDVLLSTFVKKWDRIICYDTNSYYGKLVKDYFKEKYNIDIEFYIANSGDIQFDAEHKIVFDAKNVFEDDCIIIAENCRFGKWNIDSMVSNPNVKAIITGGFLIKSMDDYKLTRF